MAQLRLYNSLTNRKEDFSPIDNDHVKVILRLFMLNLKRPIQKNIS